MSILSHLWTIRPTQVRSSASNPSTVLPPGWKLTSWPALQPDFPPQLIGQSVRITWMHREPWDEYDPPWQTYRVLDVYGNWVRLIGIDDPQRDAERTTQGNPWWAQVMEIEEIEELPEAEE